jgi:hypothetical protein
MHFGRRIDDELLEELEATCSWPTSAWRRRNTCSTSLRAVVKREKLETGEQLERCTARAPD